MAMDSHYYDPSETAKFACGVAITDGSAARGSYLTEDQAGVAMWAQRMHINGLGTYTLTRARFVVFRTYLTDRYYLDTAGISIWKRDGVNWTRLCSDSTTTIPQNTGAETFEFTWSDDTMEFEIDDASAEYYMCPWARKVVTVGEVDNGYPILRSMNVTSGDFDNEMMYIFPFADETTLPSSATDSDIQAGTNYKTPLVCQVEFTTPVRRLYYLGGFSEASLGTEDWGFIIPRRIPKTTERAPYVVRVTAAQADAGEVLYLDLGDNNASGARVDVCDWELDMGATDRITFGDTGSATSVNLDVSEAEDNFNFLLECCHDTSGNEFYDLFFQNTTTGQGDESSNADISTKSHWIGGDNAPADAEDRYSGIGSFGYLSLQASDKTAAGIGTLAVGWEPVICLGDSQMGANNAVLHRVATAVETAMDHTPIMWSSAISGSRWESDASDNYTPGYLRYRNTTTEGNGDLAYMCGAAFLFLMGLNDISGNTTTTQNDRDTLIDAMEDLLTNGSTGVLTHIGSWGENKWWIVGIPYYPNGTSDKDSAIQQWNTALRDTSITYDMPFYNTYGVSATNAGQYTPGDPGSYYLVDGIHLNDTGSAVVAPLIVTALYGGSGESNVALRRSGFAGRMSLGASARMGRHCKET